LENRKPPSAQIRTKAVILPGRLARKNSPLIVVVVALDVAAVQDIALSVRKLDADDGAVRTATARKITATTMEEGSGVIGGHHQRRSGLVLRLQPDLDSWPVNLSVLGALAAHMGAVHYPENQRSEN
jgi:hypothetical protein